MDTTKIASQSIGAIVGHFNLDDIAAIMAKNPRKVYIIGQNMPYDAIQSRFFSFVMRHQIEVHAKPLERVAHLVAMNSLDWLVMKDHVGLDVFTSKLKKSGTLTIMPSNSLFNPIDYHKQAFIVGGGPSLRDFNWSKLDGRFVVAINRSYEVLPNAQIVYFTDKDYWERHKRAMLEHKGQLIRGAINPVREEQHPRVTFYKLTGRSGIDTTAGCLRHGSNSTYAAINMLAAHMGFKTIYLLGIDMKWGRKGDKGSSHWHDGHKRIDPESGYNGFIKNYQTLVQPLKQLGTTVYNINPDSALNVFPKVTFEEIFGDDAKTGTARRQGRTTAEEGGGQPSQEDHRKDRKKAMRVRQTQGRAKPVAPPSARRARKPRPTRKPRGV